MDSFFSHSTMARVSSGVAAALVMEGLVASPKKWDHFPLDLMAAVKQISKIPQLTPSDINLGTSDGRESDMAVRVLVDMV